MVVWRPQSTRYHVRHTLQRVTVSETRMGHTRYTEFRTLPALDVFRRADLNHQIDSAPVDAQIQRSGADHGAEFACDHGGFDPVALFAGKGAVVDGDGQVFGIGKPEVTQEQLGLRAGVVEDEGGLVQGYFSQDGRDGIAATAACPWRDIIGIQHGNIGVGVGLQDLALVGVAGEEVCKGGRVFNRGGQADAAQAGGKRLAARQAQHQLIAAFGLRTGREFRR